MTFVKSLLLGSAAGLVAVAGAQAADLPMKAKAVEYVKVCDAYGAGYYFVPGTDTCLRVGGYVRFDAYVWDHGSGTPAVRVNGANQTLGGNTSYDREDNIATMRARFAVEMDARTRTEYGTLRSAARALLQVDSGAGANALTWDWAFIQFAGFTFGLVRSFYDFDGGFAMNSGLHGGFSNKTTLLAAYTASLGNGLSATIAIEDGTARRSGGIQSSDLTVAAVASTTHVTGTDGTSAQGGHAMPDIVANIRLDQSWGSAQISGAVHQLRSTMIATVANGGKDETLNDTTYGYAIGAGIKFNLDSIGKGDQLIIQGGYTTGAPEYVNLAGNTLVGSALAGMGILKGLSGAMVDIADAYTGINGEISKVDAWGISAQFRHFWTPMLRSAVFGGYTEVSVPAVCFNTACTLGTNGSGNSNSQLNSTARDFTTWFVGLNTVWSPVKNLDIGVEVVYNKIDVGGTVLAGAATGNTQAGAARAFWTQDADQIVGMLRVQRNF